MDGMTGALTVRAGSIPQQDPQQADSDTHLIALWLHGRTARTVRAYSSEARTVMAFIDKPIRAVTLGDLHNYMDTLVGLAPVSQRCRLAAVKSMLTFAHRLGYIPYNPGAAIRSPPVKDVRAERIMSVKAVHRLLDREINPRNAAMLALLYGAGLRISELCGLAWRDLQPRDDAGQVTVFGKGCQTRVILLPASVWRAVIVLQGDAALDAPVFRSRSRGGHLDPASVHRMVKLAASRAGLPASISAHWLRHAHASHALDNQAPISLVQATLGHASVATTGRYLHARPNDSSARYLGL